MMASQPPHKKQKFDQISKLFANLNAFVLEQGLGKTRRKIFADQLKKHGANVVASFNKEEVQYLMVSKDLKLERILKLLKCKELPDSVIIVSVDWISASLVSGSLEVLDKYQLFTSRCQSIEVAPKDDVQHDFPASSSQTFSRKRTPTTTTTTTTFEQLITLKQQIEIGAGSSSSDEKEEHEIKQKEYPAKNLPVIINVVLSIISNF